MGIESLVKPLPNNASLYSCAAGGVVQWSTARVSPGQLIFWRILGQVLFPFNFNQLVQLHGGLGIFH